MIYLNIAVYAGNDFDSKTALCYWPQFDLALIWLSSELAGDDMTWDCMHGVMLHYVHGCKMVATELENYTQNDHFGSVSCILLSSL